jgi:hypothetical protein
MALRGPLARWSVAAGAGDRLPEDIPAVGPTPAVVALQVDATGARPPTVKSRWTKVASASRPPTWGRGSRGGRQQRPRDSRAAGRDARPRGPPCTDSRSNCFRSALRKSELSSTETVDALSATTPGADPRLRPSRRAPPAGRHRPEARRARRVGHPYHEVEDMVHPERGNRRNRVSTTSSVSACREGWRPVGGGGSSVGDGLTLERPVDLWV